MCVDRDVANSVSDFVMARLGRGGDCGCNDAPPAPHFSAAAVADLAPRLDGHWQRWRLLAELLEAVVRPSAAGARLYFIFFHLGRVG